MRFIVDAYRLIILAILAAALIGGSYLLFSVLLASDPQSQLGGWAIVWFLATAIVIVLTIGVTATFISIHDRLVDIADHSRRIAEALERGNDDPR